MRVLFSRKLADVKFHKNKTIAKISKFTEMTKLQAPMINPFTIICVDYCKFRNFRENFIFGNSVNRHICQVKISRLLVGPDLPTSVSSRVIFSFPDDFIFKTFCICEVSRI